MLRNLKDESIQDMFSPNKTFTVYVKTTPPSFGLTSKRTSRIFTFVGLRWIPTGKTVGTCLNSNDSAILLGKRTCTPNTVICANSSSLSFSETGNPHLTTDVIAVLTTSFLTNDVLADTLDALDNNAKSLDRICERTEMPSDEILKEAVGTVAATVRTPTLKRKLIRKQGEAILANSRRANRVWRIIYGISWKDEKWYLCDVVAIMVSLPLSSSPWSLLKPKLLDENQTTIYKTCYKLNLSNIVLVVYFGPVLSHKFDGRNGFQDIACVRRNPLLVDGKCPRRNIMQADTSQSKGGTTSEEASRRSSYTNDKDVQRNDSDADDLHSNIDETMQSQIGYNNNYFHF
ncbi:hypothetical protein Tco_0592929 [Tanacetum coccineum]